MKGAFDSASVIVIVMVSMMLLLMTVTIISSAGVTDSGSFAATNELTVSVENYKKQYEGHMTLAALISDKNWREKAGIYHADSSRSSAENYISSDAEELLSGQSQVYSLELNENDPLISAKTDDVETPQAFSEIYIASPKQEQLKVRVGVGNTRPVLTSSSTQTDPSVGVVQ